jgi:hypothetical protein
MGVLLNKAKTFARDGVLSAREVGQLLSGALKDGVLEVAQRKDLHEILTSMGPALTPEARKAIGSILSNTAFLPNLSAYIRGLSGKDADVFEKQGIVVPKDLLLRARTEDGRTDLAGKTGFSASKILELAEKIDLSRARGVGSATAAVLHKVGVKNIQTLASSEPTELRRKISEFLITPSGKAIMKRRPTLEKVTSWIENAKTQPRAIVYPGTQQPGFTKSAFEALSKDEKAQLLFGYDVVKSDGSRFDSGDLKFDTVQRKPQAIADLVEKLEGNKLEGAYDNVSFSLVERVKLNDDTIGFRIVFDVSTGEPEGEVVDPGESVGTVQVVCDPNGNVLGQEDDVYSNDNHE